MTPGIQSLDREVQRRDTGPTHADRTGAFCAPASDWEYAEAMKRQAAAFELKDLLEETDAHILYLLKAGFAEEAGRQLALRMKATIARRVASELA